MNYLFFAVAKLGICVNEAKDIANACQTSNMLEVVRVNVHTDVDARKTNTK